MADRSATTAPTIILDDDNHNTRSNGIDKRVMDTLREENIYLPTVYLKKMAEKKLLNKFILMVTFQSMTNKRIKSLLSKYPICIPMEFFPYLVHFDLLEPMIKMANEITGEEHLFEVNAVKRSYDDMGINGHIPKRVRRDQQDLVEDRGDVMSPLSNISDDDNEQIVNFILNDYILLVFFSFYFF
jgi:hypothetical protein